MTSVRQPMALATSASLRIEAMKASAEKGRTMPDVPMMEMPPTMPSFGLNVLVASSSPPGTEIVTVSPGLGGRFLAAGLF